MDKPRNCPDCDIPPTIYHGDHDVSITCRNCYDAELLDNQWVSSGWHVSVPAGWPGERSWTKAEEFAIMRWNEDIETELEERDEKPAA
jgi:hypothetical protein